jgi:hypothetical protein
MGDNQRRDDANGYRRLADFAAAANARAQCREPRHAVPEGVRRLL